MEVRRFKAGELSERGSASLNVEVTVDIAGFWTLKELERLVDRMSEIDEKMEDVSNQLGGA